MTTVTTSTRRTPVLLLMLALLGGCAAQPQPELASDNCRRVLADWQRTVASQPHDAQAKSLDAHGIFATNRTLSHLAGTATTPEKRQEWLALSSQLARKQRQINYTNTQLPATQRQAIEACALTALTTQQQRAEQQALPFTKQQLHVADNYHIWQRVLGAYPIARAFVRPRIVKEQTAALQRFGNINNGNTTRYYGAETTSNALTPQLAAQLLDQARRNSALGLPELPPQDMARFIDHYAPAWAIDTRGSDDVPGRVIWKEAGQPAVDHLQPTVYSMPGMTWLNGQALLQLNYFLWFDERPKQHPLDMYGGRLDGVIWRVTLLPDGRVLAYDSIHQCGCYHQFYIVDKQLTARPQPSSAEPLLTFDQAIPDALHQRVQVHLSHTEHAITTVIPAPKEPLRIHLQQQDYANLRRLEHGDERRSLFDSRGLVPQSARLERFILWPMGVPSAGAMRQWGHHATAFIGRRHFDEPLLLDNLFLYSSAGPTSPEL